MSFIPSKPPPKSRAPWILAAVALVVAVVFGVVTLTGGSDDSDETAGGAATTAASANDATNEATNEATDGSAAGGTTASSAPAPAGPSLSGGKPVATAAVTITGTPLVAARDGGTDPAAGKAFPELSGLSTFDGSALSIAKDGRPKVIIFIAHWCPHCQREVPVIVDWLAANGTPTDVDLYAVSTGVAADRGNFPPAAWLIKENWPVPTLADDEKGSAFAAAGLTSFPSFVAVDAAGNVVLRTSGELSTSQFEALLARAAG